MNAKNEAAVQEQQDTQSAKYLTFHLENEVFGLEIEHITEIIGIQQITAIPNVAGYIKGIINLRGKIIPVIDMRLKFKKQPADYTDRTCIIVAESQEISVGLIVDQVSEVMNIADADISAPPSGRTGLKNKYINGVGKVDGEIKLLLDCDALLEEEQKAAETTEE